MGNQQHISVNDYKQHLANKNNRKTKYGNVKQTYNGYSYDSKFEASVAEDLDWRLKAGDIAGWERQFKVTIEYNGKTICAHKVDFRVLHNDGTYELVEAKGFETEGWRLKRKLLEIMWLPEHPDHTYSVVRQGWR